MDKKKKISIIIWYERCCVYVRNFSGEFFFIILLGLGYGVVDEWLN